MWGSSRDRMSTGGVWQKWSLKNWWSKWLALRGTSVDAPWCECRALLVQDGANAVTPEKIQGATMPYG